MTLAQGGMNMPFTVISHPARTRSNCSNETSRKTVIAVVVKGFKRRVRSGFLDYAPPRAVSVRYRTY